MKKLLLAAFLAAFTVPSLNAAINYSSGYYGQTVFTHSTADNIISFDYAGSDTYYMTGDAGSNFTGLWSTGSGSPLVTAPGRFAGSSVVTEGDHVFYNTSDTSFVTHIDNYGPLSGSPSGSAVSTASNYSLASHGGNIFIAGFGASSNEIFYAPVNASGQFTQAPVSLGAQPASSGPMLFDAGGNLYYATGFASDSNDFNIYKWSAAELAAAIADPIVDPLDAANVWLNFGALFPGLENNGGATSMAFDENGDLVMSVTNFIANSSLVRFGVDGAGDYDGFNETLLTDSGRLGEVRNDGGDIVFASDNQLIRVIPEPGTGALVALAGGLVLLRRRR